MSSKSIQRRLDKAYGKGARKLGSDTDFLIYRSSTLTCPLAESNWIDTKPVAFSLDDKFKKAHDGGLSLWLCWIDGRLSNNFDLQQGDFLYNPDTEETYYISARQRNLPIRAIKATSTITVNRSTYTDGANGFGPGDTEVATDIPCWIEEPSSGGGGLGYIPAPNYGRDSVPNYKIYCWDPDSTLQRRDAIVDQNGVRSQIINIETNDLGTILTTAGYSAE